MTVPSEIERLQNELEIIEADLSREKSKHAPDHRIVKRLENKAAIKRDEVRSAANTQHHNGA